MAEKTKAQLEQENEGLSKLLEDANAELKAALEKVAAMEDGNDTPVDERIKALEDANAELKAALETAKVEPGAKSAAKGAVPPARGTWGLLEQLAAPLVAGSSFGVTEDVARDASVDPWFFVETINFRNDSGYDNNWMRRAISALETRAFVASRLGVDSQGQQTALPTFKTGNRILVAVAILPGEDD